MFWLSELWSFPLNCCGGTGFVYTPHYIIEVIVDRVSEGVGNEVQGGGDGEDIEEKS